MSRNHRARRTLATLFLAIGLASGCSLRNEMSADPGGEPARDLGANKTSGGSGTGTSVGPVGPKADGNPAGTETHSGEGAPPPAVTPALPSSKPGETIPGTDTNSGQTSAPKG